MVQKEEPVFRSTGDSGQGTTVRTVFVCKTPLWVFYLFLSQACVYVWFIYFAWINHQAKIELSVGSLCMCLYYTWQTHNTSHFKCWSHSVAHSLAVVPSSQLCCFLGPAAALQTRDEPTTVLRAFSAAPVDVPDGFNGERESSVSAGHLKIQSLEEILKIRVENISQMDWKVIDSGMKLITCGSWVVSDITNILSSGSVYWTVISVGSWKSVGFIGFGSRTFFSAVFLFLVLSTTR